MCVFEYGPCVCDGVCVGGKRVWLCACVCVSDRECYVMSCIVS